MKCQSLYSRTNKKKNILNVSSAKVDQNEVSVKEYCI